MRFVKPELANYITKPMTRRENLEDHLRRHATFFPLLVGATISLGTAKGDHDIGGGADLGLSFFGIPQEIACDENVRDISV